MDKKEILQTVDTLTEELTAFLQTLVQTPSLPNREYDVQQIIAAKLRSLGLDVDVITTNFDKLRDHPAFDDDGFSPDSRINVVGRFQGNGPTTGQGSLILQGHVDVVSPGDETLWVHSPWSGHIEDGKLYGRGSCDMKAGVTAVIFAIATLKKLGYQPAHDILVQTVIGEESGGVGALTTIIEGYRADAAIILEPTRMEICPVQAGALTFRLTVQGKAAHGAMKSDGVSALDKLMLLNADINDLDRERHEAYNGRSLYDNPYNIAPISIGTVEGGDWHSTVMEKAVVMGRYGVFPGQSVAEARELLATRLAEVCASDDWLREHPPQLEWIEGQFESGETAVDHPIIQTLQQNHQHLHSQAAPLKGVPYGADMRLYTNHADIPTILYGPGDVRMAHAVNEFVPLSEVIAVTKAIALTVVDWCGIATE